jgi:hypothetical protein
MKVFPVRYKAKSPAEMAASGKRLRYPEGAQGTYFVVARSVGRAEEIAFECIAANCHPQLDQGDRPADDGRAVANVRVMDTWAAETDCLVEGLIGTGSEAFCAKAFALYCGTTGKLH